MWLIELSFPRFLSGSFSRFLFLYCSSNRALSSLICSVVFLYFLGINWHFWPFFWIPHFALHLCQWLRSLLPNNYKCFDQSCCLPFSCFLSFCVEITTSVREGILYALCESFFGDQCSLDTVFWATHCFEAVTVFPKRSLLYSYPIAFLFVITLFWQCVLPGAGGSWISWVFHSCNTFSKQSSGDVDSNISGSCPFCLLLQSLTKDLESTWKLFCVSPL